MESTPNQDNARRSPCVVVWPCQAVYWGAGFSSASHRHHATQVGLSLDEPFRVRIGTGPEVELTSFVIAPHVPHRLETSAERVLLVWSQDGALARFARQQGGPESPGWGALPPALERGLVAVMASHGGTLATVEAGQEVLTALTQSAEVVSETGGDPRVERALQEVTGPFLAHRRRFSDRLADLVHLSTSRFRHVFAGQTGASVQRFVLWQRTLAAVWSSLHHGESLTRAAHDWGFADQAHLTRVFRQTFGMAPSTMFQRRPDLRLLLGSEGACHETS